MSKKNEIPLIELLTGIKKCQELIDSYIKDAQKYQSENNYQLAYLLGFSAWEECGKAFYILDYQQKNEPIPRREWSNTKSFMGHIPKIKKAREEGIKNAFEDLKERRPEYPNIHLVDFEAQPSKLKQYWNYRNNCLYLHYDFKDSSWNTYKDYENLESLTERVISNAVISFIDLQDTLQRKGIETQWTHLASFEIKL